MAHIYNGILLSHKKTEIELFVVRWMDLESVIQNEVSHKEKDRGFPGGAVVESLPADAGYTGSCPGLGRSHMPRSGWAREPWPLSLCVRSLCSATGEATTVRGPRTANK